MVVVGATTEEYGGRAVLHLASTHSAEVVICVPQTNDWHLWNRHSSLGLWQTARNPSEPLRSETFAKWGLASSDPKFDKAYPQVWLISDDLMFFLHMPWNLPCHHVCLSNLGLSCWNHWLLNPCYVATHVRLGSPFFRVLVQTFGHRFMVRHFKGEFLCSGTRQLGCGNLLPMSLHSQLTGHRETKKWYIELEKSSFKRYWWSVGGFQVIYFVALISFAGWFHAKKDWMHGMWFANMFLWHLFSSYLFLCFQHSSTFEQTIRIELPPENIQLWASKFTQTSPILHVLSPTWGSQWDGILVDVEGFGDLFVTIPARGHVQNRSFPGCLWHSWYCSRLKRWCFFHLTWLYLVFFWISWSWGDLSGLLVSFRLPGAAKDSFLRKMSLVLEEGGQGLQ